MNSSGVRVTLMLTTPGWRGSGAAFTSIARGLLRAGHQVQIITGHFEVAERVEAAGLEVQLVPAGNTGRREVAAVRQLLSRHRTGVVIADSPRDVRIARYASALRRRTIIWRYNLHSRRLATDVLQRWLFGGLSTIVQQSEYGRVKLATESPWLAGIATVVIPNGFDIEALPPSPERGAAFRRQYGIHANETLIVTPTAAQVEKQVQVARDAVARLAQHRPVTWLVADAAELETAPGVGMRVIAPTRMRQEVLHDAIRAADVVLLPSPVELFGNVTAEAMALGAAIVAADGGATPEVVGDGGVLFAAGDAAAAARTVAELLDDHPRRNALGAAARRRISEHYSLVAMEERYDRLVRRR